MAHEATPARETGGSAPVRVVVGAVAGLAVAICLMLLAFAAPAVNSGPHDLPLAVTGPADVVAGATSALDQRQPGAFDPTTYADAAGVVTAIEDRDAVGGIAFGVDGVTVYTASAAGTPYASVLAGVASGLAAAGQTVTVSDVVPLTTDDPAGSGLGVLALPMVFGGMASAVVLTLVARGSRVRRVVAALSFAVLAGFAAAAVLQYWLGSVDGSYWLTAVSISFGVAAIATTVLGLEALFGYPGFGIGAAVMLFVANPLSGMATGPAWLPSPWGTIGQFLPVGAAGTAIRSAAFFDGAGSALAYLVLAGWVVLGFVLLGLAAVRRRRSAPQQLGRVGERPTVTMAA